MEAELAHVVSPHRNVDAILTTEKAAIQEEVRAAAQKRLNEFQTGVLLSTVNIESVSPPPRRPTRFAMWPARGPTPSAS